MTRSSPGQLEMDLAVTARAVGLVRTIVGAHVRLWGLEPLVERTVLASSELLTNVVKHVPPSRKGLAPNARLILTRVPGDGLFLCVHDPDPALPQLGCTPLDAEDGRGISLIAACADEYGVTPATGGGKDVWLTLFPGDRS
ncbi:ATP-binding protein [Streptomyces sp. NPDC050535]|uniref:ATP-binding protein n=1 Tax=Streptomyces sp. NPDC050535 TaxID=3365626 RepID=UPI0037B520D7